LKVTDCVSKFSFLAFIQGGLLHVDVCCLCFLNFELNELGLFDVVLKWVFEVFIVNKSVNVKNLEGAELKKLPNVFRRFTAI
jgi:hypothetical protein